MIPVSLPGTATRQKILESYAAGRNISLSAESLKLLADKFPGTAARLRVKEGGSNTIKSHFGIIFSCGLVSVCALSQSKTLLVSKEH